MHGALQKWPTNPMLVHHELMFTSMVEVVPYEAYEENPSLHPRRESYHYHEEN